MLVVRLKLHVGRFILARLFFQLFRQQRELVQHNNTETHSLQQGERLRRVQGCMPSTAVHVRQKLRVYHPLRLGGTDCAERAKASSAESALTPHRWNTCQRPFHPWNHARGVLRIVQARVSSVPVWACGANGDAQDTAG